MHQMTGLPVHVLSSVVGQATHSAISGHDAGRGRSRQTPTHDGRGSGAPTTGPRRRQGARERHEQPERDRRIEDVAGRDLVRPGELVRLEVRPAAEPADRRRRDRASKSTPNGCSSGCGMSNTNRTGITKTNADNATATVRCREALMTATAARRTARRGRRAPARGTPPARSPRPRRPAAPPPS